MGVSIETYLRCRWDVERRRYDVARMSCFRLGQLWEKKNNNRDPELKVSDIVRISNYKNIFGKGYTRNLFEEVFMIKKVKNALPWIYVINDLDGVPNC